ncbi:glycosyltransferase family 4 protein [Pseudoalteromonas sp. SSM20]|uniref:glycosyltransferase family 4 protein n=1 Tax=Pseudoalteromonas sp. SSM20 TaxID=3139394 RepID=UPI003BAD0325
MKITFVSPKPIVCGGIRVVAIYTQLLLDLGHDVSVLAFTKKGTVKQRIKAGLLHQKKFSQIGLDTTLFDNFSNENFKLIEIKNSGPVSEDFPDADIIIATWWETAEWIENLPDSKGKKVHFIQGYEVLPHTPKDRVEAIYKSDKFKQIAVSSWLKQKIENDFNQTGIELLANGVDSDCFFYKEKAFRGYFYVGVLYSMLVTKNSARALDAFEIAKKQNTKLKLIGFSGDIDIPDHHKEMFDDLYIKPAQAKIPDIYQSADVWLFPSDEEGFGLPILEAMACGTPVIATAAGAAPELIEQGGGFLTKNFSTVEIAQKIIEYCDLDEEEKNKITLSARKTGEKHNWRDLTLKFESILNTILYPEKHP